VNSRHVCKGHLERWKGLDIAHKNGKLENMKATLDIPDDLYKRVKARSAMEGKPIRSVAIELFQIWIQTPSDTGVENESVSLSTEDYKKYPWLELARKFKNGSQSSDFREIKKSIAMGWAKEVALDREALDK
jgi:hypothetical protein